MKWKSHYNVVYFLKNVRNMQNMSIINGICLRSNWMGLEVTKKWGDSLVHANSPSTMFDDQISEVKTFAPTFIIQK